MSLLKVLIEAVDIVLQLFARLLLGSFWLRRNEVNRCAITRPGQLGWRCRMRRKLLRFATRRVQYKYLCFLAFAAPGDKCQASSIRRPARTAFAAFAVGQLNCFARRNARAPNIAHPPVILPIWLQANECQLATVRGQLWI